MLLLLVDVECEKGICALQVKRGWMDMYIEHTNTTHFVYVGAGIRAENGRTT